MVDLCILYFDELSVQGYVFGDNVDYLCVSIMVFLLV